MKEWKKIRNEEISEHMLVTHIICFLIFFMAAISLYGFNNSILAFDWKVVSVVVIAALIIISYTGKKLVSGLRLAVKPTFWDFSLFLVVFLFSITILTITGHSNSPVKILFLIPVIISSTSYGKTFGLVTAGTASAILFYFDFASGFESTPSIKFQIDIVNSTVMLSLAWLIGGLADIEKVVRENLTNLANTDDLTGLSNHRHFHENLRHVFKTSKENNSPLSLIMFDIDYFKFYNDSYGHQMGDEVIKQIGSVLNEVVKKPNCAARYGGDEFTVIVPDYEYKAMDIAQEIREAIEAYSFEGAEIQPKGKLTVSMGVAGFPKQGKTPKELVRLADEALYKAKYSKNKVQLYFSVMDDLREGIAETERDLFNSVKTLISIINAKDRYTFGHSERVSYYSMRLAEQINLPKEDVTLLRYGAFLHDIGKIEIERDILNKIGPLKTSEWTTLRKHPVWGSDIVRPITSLKEIVPAILYHHENFDGTGYPSGLSGHGIPLQARILRLTDSFDAMTTDRPYKKGKTVSESCSELKKCSGTLFDPALVDPFIEFILKENSEHPALKGFNSVI